MIPRISSRLEVWSTPEWRVLTRLMLLGSSYSLPVLLGHLQTRRWAQTSPCNLTESCECLFCSIFASLVDALSVIPEAGTDFVMRDEHSAAPCSSSACDNVSASFIF